LAQAGRARRRDVRVSAEDDARLTATVCTRVGGVAGRATTNHAQERTDQSNDYNTHHPAMETIAVVHVNTRDDIVDIWRTSNTSLPRIEDE